MIAEQTFFKQGDIYMLGTDRPNQRFPILPGGIYLIGFSMDSGFYLETLPNFELPKKLYGDIEKKADRILATFDDRPKTTGVLLSGEKGSGKTLLTKTICEKAAKNGMPTLVVNNPFGGDRFNTFLQSITQPCVLLFDEFEKVYDEDSQKGLLTLFDGIFTTKKLILLTTNDYVKVNSHLQNRPGRIYYNLEFNGLDMEFINEYGQDRLNNPNHLNGLNVVASLVKPMSFDILQAIVEECNRYDESPVKAMEMLNVKEQSSYADNYTVEIVRKDGSNVSLNEVSDESETRTNPFKPFRLEYWRRAPRSKKFIYTVEMVYPDNLINFDGIKGVYEYDTATIKVKLTRKPFEYANNFQKYEKLAGGESED